MMVPTLRVMQEDRDPVVWQQVEGTVKFMTAMENCPGFRGREVSMGESCLSTRLGLAQEEINVNSSWIMMWKSKSIIPWCH